GVRLLKTRSLPSGTSCGDLLENCAILVEVTTESKETKDLKVQQGRKNIALVLSGGGARGAYEAGILHYVRTMLPSKSRYRTFETHCGSSVGAINTCYLAATAHDLDLQAKEIRNLWVNLKADNIYRRNMMAFVEFLGSSGKGIVTNLFRSKKINHFEGF